MGGSDVWSNTVRAQCRAKCWLDVTLEHAKWATADDAFLASVWLLLPSKCSNFQYLSCLDRDVLTDARRTNESTYPQRFGRFRAIQSII